MRVLAHRLAIHARADATRQERREISFAQLDVTNSGWHGEETAGRLPERYHPLENTAAEIEHRDLRRLVDNELLQLPEKYQAQWSCAIWRVEPIKRQPRCSVGRPAQFRRRLDGHHAPCGNGWSTEA